MWKNGGRNIAAAVKDSFRLTIARLPCISTMPAAAAKQCLSKASFAEAAANKHAGEIRKRSVSDGTIFALRSVRYCTNSIGIYSG